MRYFAFLFLSLFTIQPSKAQNVANLSYPEIDSLIQMYEGRQAYDKGLAFSLAASQKSGTQDSLCGEYLDYAAYFCELKMENGKAIEFYQKTLDVFAKATGVHSARYAKTLNFLAVLHQNMGNYDQALPLFVQTLSIDEKALGKEHPDFATSLNNLALLHLRMGNFNEALPLFLQSKKIREKVLGKAHPDFATSLNNLAFLHQKMGNFDQAMSLFIQASPLIKKSLGKEHPLFASTLNNLANLHQKMGNYDQALHLYMQATAIYEKTLGKQHAYYATSLNNVALLHQKMGNYDQALLLYEQAKNIRAEALGELHPNFANSLNNLALLHKDMDQIDEAMLLYLQAIDIYEKTLGKEHPTFATSLNNLALLYQKKGNLNKALLLYEQAKDIREKALGKLHPDLATSLNSLALLHQQMGNIDKAWASTLQAIEVCTNTRLSRNINPSWTDTLLNTAFPSNLHAEYAINTLHIIFALLEEQNEVERQIILTDLVAALLAKLRNNVSNDKDKLRMLDKSSEWLQNSLAILDQEKDIQKAFLRADQNKSVLLLQASKSEQTYRLGNLPDSLIWKDKKILQSQSQLQAKLLEKRPEHEKDSLRNELNHLNQDMDVFLQMIKRKYPKYHALKYQQVDASVADIQQLLDDETALIEYVMGDSILHIFCVDNKQVQWKQVAVPHDQLMTRIQKMHKTLSNYKAIVYNEKTAYTEYVGQAYWFYQNLVAPVLEDKKQLKNLIIVTDGALGHLPFETFLVEPAPQQVSDYKQLHYLITDYNISYNYSATLWKENIETPLPKNNGQILGMAANYEFQLDSAMMDIRLATDQWMRKALVPLPEAKQEVETLQKNYQGFFAFDQLASEKIVKEKASDFAILHFATHGILNANMPILSSLAFTEDNDSLESNFWQAHEISKMELKADLVVLSACETGFGKFEKGNGIASLARAFMYAGASSLIVSLWQVNDYATSEIMRNLYANLAKGMKKDEALRQAKLQYMSTSEGIVAHPVFWSPFIQMGNTTPVRIQTKGGGLWPWFIAVGLVVLVLGAFAMNRREK